jgi:hypothetical protein
VVDGNFTAHPIGPVARVFWGAGFAAVPCVGFVLAVTVAAAVRAFSYSFFGSTLLDFGAPRFWVATAVLAAVALLPLTHAGFRARMMRVARAGAKPAPP